MHMIAFHDHEGGSQACQVLNAAVQTHVLYSLLPLSWLVCHAATMYYPVEVAGGLLSMGDCHGSQSDGETAATGIETSLNGKFRYVTQSN